jgi:hypothetical protein
MACCTRCWRRCDAELCPMSETRSIAEYDLIRELLREIHDLKKEISDGPDRQADSRDRAA